MLRVFVTLCILHCLDLYECQKSPTVTPLANPTQLPQAPHTILTEDKPEDDPDKTSAPHDVSIPEVVLETSSGTNIPKNPHVKNKVYNIPVDVFQNFSLLHWWRPVQENFEKLKEFLANTKHPNYGGVQYLSPQEIWEKLHEKGHHLLTGVNGAVFGLANVENHDYPFAYRKLRSSLQ